MRTICFIDGFNFYHPIDKDILFHKYKWINIRQLAQCFTLATDEIIDVLYFTAQTKHSTEKQVRQKLFWSVCEHFEVKIIQGEFKKANRYCKNCHTYYKDWQEKLTDVNIASHLIKYAFLNQYEKAIMMCGDYDITPAVKTVKELYPEKIIEMVIPLNGKAEQSKPYFDRSHQLSTAQLESCILPERFIMRNGKQAIRPAEWR